VDVFINTVDPVDEPVLCTVNSVLSILATDYPADKHATYLSDDGGSLVHYEALQETARFAALWTPFCRKHRVEPRAPESYFSAKADGPPYAGTRPGSSSTTGGACGGGTRSSRRDWRRCSLSFRRGRSCSSARTPKQAVTEPRTWWIGSGGLARGLSRLRTTGKGSTLRLFRYVAALRTNPY
jgi:hypothetical protein